MKDITVSKALNIPGYNEGHSTSTGLVMIVYPMLTLIELVYKFGRELFRWVLLL